VAKQEAEAGIPRIIATTPRWLAIDKPAGWLTIPGRGHAGTPVLVEWARAIDPAVQIVHRLDLETSGVLLFARSPEAHREANDWFSNHRVTKYYDFLASGRALLPMMRIQEPIEGAASTTQVEVKESFATAFLGSARPLSGRRHQIRIHLANRGHPILGDEKYGGRRELEVAEGMLHVGRVALHAARLDLPGGESFAAPWPADFRAWVETLRGRGAPEQKRGRDA
jgi:23S rRNA pseudouridine1911/1915/1917 synthase